MKHHGILLTFVALLLFALPARPDDDPLRRWRHDVQIRPVSPGERHSIHSYFNTCPESPDGKWVLFYTSATPDAQRGEVRIRERATGEEKVLARNVSTEDAHRAACQQWVSNGHRVVFHDERDGEWLVAVVDVATGNERVLARDRLVSWSQPNADVVPLYGKHWNPGPHRDLELLNVATGEIRTVLTADALKAAYPQWIAKRFGDKPVSIFFPVLSPDLKRVFFKVASAGNGNPRSGGASVREGLVCYSLEEKRFLFMNEKWGHPAWHPDGRTIVELSFTLYDSNTGKMQRTPGLPSYGSGHPSASPDGKLLVTDVTMDKLGGSATHWGVAVADARGTNHVVIHEADNSRGARSWRRSHPHPIFSADGRRIYFNVSSSQWTQLYVAECAQ
ncbi:MAG: hypothetical protein AB1705_22090 [Verrucomicrobiota bacterium]